MIMIKKLIMAGLPLACMPFFSSALAESGIEYDLNTWIFIVLLVIILIVALLVSLIAVRLRDMI